MYFYIILKLASQNKSNSNFKSAFLIIGHYIRMSGNSTVVKQVKDPALSLQGLLFHSWPCNFHMPWVQPKKKKGLISFYHISFLSYWKSFKILLFIYSYDFSIILLLFEVESIYIYLCPVSSKLLF